VTSQQWLDYLEQVKLQFHLIDQLEPRFKPVIWETGFDPTRVRQMLAHQRKDQRLARAASPPARA
jgi:hypothetical protein